MLKTLMLGAAMVLAVPALAQTTGSSNPDMNKPGSAGTAGGTSDQASGTGAMNGGTSMGATSRSGTTDSDWGRTGTTGTAGTTGMTGTMGSSQYTGQGGPAEGARDYPACSRTLRDNCIQRGGGHGGRGARHHGRR